MDSMNTHTAITDLVKTKYAGADWLKTNLSFAKPKAAPVSQLGEIVADILGQLYEGIYHIEDNFIFKVDWSSNRMINITLPDGGGRFATFDASLLTHLVILAQAAKVRIAITAATHGYLRLSFSFNEKHFSLQENCARYLNP